MSYTPVEDRIGIQPIAVANVPPPATFGTQSGQSPFFGQEHPLGTIIRAYDPIYGEGEFIYLQMASGQVVGNAVTWGGFGTVGSGSVSQSQYQAVLVPNTASLGNPVGIAMSAFPSGSPATAYGWFQVAGQAVAKVDSSVGAITAGVQVGIGTTAGILSTASAGKRVMNAISVTAAGTPSAGFAVVEIQRPAMEPIAT